MTGQLWLVAALLVGAAAAVAWPLRPGRNRRRAILGTARRPGADRSSPVLRAPTRSGRLSGTPRAARRVRAGAVDRPRPTRPPGRRDPAHPVTASAVAAGATSPARLRAAASRRWRRRAEVPRTGPALLLAALVGGATGAVLGGPVAGVVLAVYGTLAARGVRRRQARRRADRAHRRDLDQLCALAADLRAGLPVGTALGDGPQRIARLARAAVRLADRTGAPLAELLERVEADARAADRGLAAAAAQSAGARATAWLLAALPLGGIGLGYAIGVDPVAVLLHTTVGGGSALAAVGLQVGGLLWAERLSAGPGRAA